jgi:hypothetical protein
MIVKILTHAYGDIHLVMLAHLRRWWSLIRCFSGSETPIFHCAGGKETKAKQSHWVDRTLNRMLDQMRLAHLVNSSREQREDQLGFLTGASDTPQDQCVRSTWHGATSQ